MSEILRSRNLARASIILASFMVNACASGKQSKLNASNHVQGVAKERHLIVGDNIDHVRLIEPKSHEVKTITLKSTDSASQEDLAFIYSPSESQTLINQFGEPKLGESVGLLLSDNVGKLATSIVYFSPTTHTADLVSPSADLGEGHTPLIQYVDPRNLGDSYTVTVYPVSGHNNEFGVDIQPDKIINVGPSSNTTTNGSPS